MTATLERTDTLIETKEDLQQVYGDTVREAARKIASEMILLDADDIEQDTWVHLLENFDTVVQAENMRALIYSVARRVTGQARTDNMHFTGSYIYTPEDVRKILSESAWSEIDQCPDVEGRVDVLSKFKMLSPGRRLALYRRYALGVTHKAMTESERLGVKRGITDLTNRLNRALNHQPISLEDTIENNPELLEGK